MKLNLCAAIVSVIMSTTALAGAEFHPSTYTTYKQHAAHKGNVDVLNALPNDALSYTEIGMVRVSTDQVTSYDQALEQIKSEAARHGGNGIVLEDDAKLFATGKVTQRGTKPKKVTAVAIIKR